MKKGHLRWWGDRPCANLRCSGHHLRIGVILTTPVRCKGFVWHVYTISNNVMTLCCKGTPPNSPPSRFERIPEKVTAEAAAAALRVINPLFGHEGDSAECTLSVHSRKDAQVAVLEPTVADEETQSVHVQCEHGFVLVSGE